MGIILRGREVSDGMMDNLKDRANKINQKKQMKLAIVRAGDDPASYIYVRNKKRACEKVGIETCVHYFKNPSQSQIESKVEELGRDDSVTGIIVQLPLPDGIDEHKVISAINPLKDIDGITPVNSGLLSLGKPSLSPCTPEGIIDMLDWYGIGIEGKNCVIVGRSNIVGRPMLNKLINRNATVTLCHSHTKNLKSICQNADILICATGISKMFNREYISEGTVVVDVGIHRDSPSGKLNGDVDFEDVKDIASAITPVPGGVGVMTVNSVVKNCIKAAELQFEAD